MSLAKLALFLSTFVVTTSSVVNAAPCVLSNVLGDHMVLQRDRPVTVWGFADPGVTVQGTFNNNQYKATTDGNSTWRIVLPATPASPTSYTLTFACSSGENLALNDVLFGDVHICSGQSNMQFTLLSNAGVPNVTAELQTANNYPLIRVFTVGQGNSSTVPFTQLASIEQKWAVASNLSIGFGSWSAFSAVCWFTYRDVYDKLGGNVPQGLISNNWGGTPIQHWSSPTALDKCNGGKDSILWNAMIYPYTVGPMALRTAIWYQGENNVGQASYYACQFPVMIADWRTNLPGLNTFGFVQIAGYTGYGTSVNAGDLRSAQLTPLSSLNNIAFTTAIDLVYPWSSPSDIHPTYKQAVGDRLSNSILVSEYGLNFPSSYPMYAGASTTTSGTTITVTVDLNGCVGGCSVINQVIPPGVAANVTASFAIQTDDPNKTWWNCTSVTPTPDGHGLVLSVVAPATGFNAIASAYGRGSYPIVAAYNTQQLPVLPWCYTMNNVPCYAANDVSDNESVTLPSMKDFINGY